MNRRFLIRRAVPAIGVAFAAGWLPRRLLAAAPMAGPDDWPVDAFHAESVDDVQRLLFGDVRAEESDRIAITAPDIAENGRVVPVEVVLDLPAPRTLVLLSESNPFPLLARVHFGPAVLPRVAQRVKLGGSGNLIALVEGEGALHRASRWVKVTSGGCGG